MDWVSVASPIGDLGVSVAGEAVQGVSFGLPERPVPGSGLASAVAAELAEYFAGTRMAFDVPYAFRRGTEFERAVWSLIAEIPYGQTMSYGELARAAGEPGGAQAVGRACNRNPVPILVPCHRVIGADGKLVGFGGGLHRKRFLLQLEARVYLSTPVT